MIGCVRKKGVRPMTRNKGRRGMRGRMSKSAKNEMSVKARMVYEYGVENVRCGTTVCNSKSCMSPLQVQIKMRLGKQEVQESKENEHDAHQILNGLEI